MVRHRGLQGHQNLVGACVRTCCCAVPRSQAEALRGVLSDDPAHRTLSIAQRRAEPSIPGSQVLEGTPEQGTYSRAQASTGGSRHKMNAWERDADPSDATHIACHRSASELAPSGAFRFLASDSIGCILPQAASSPPPATSRARPGRPSTHDLKQHQRRPGARSCLDPTLHQVRLVADILTAQNGKGGRLPDTKHRTRASESERFC